MTEEQCSIESILRVLLVNARFLDSNRFLAGFRRPGRLTRRLMQDLVELHEEVSNG